jgi:threonine aldolase
MTGMVDLRSDTVTQPSPEMREAMYRAEVGDDGYGEDRTVARLQELAAEKTGKEAALLVPSGCMANLVALLVFCQGRSEVILGRSTDMFIYEVGAMSFVGGIHPAALENCPDGTLDLHDIERAIRVPDVHFPTTRAICLENTHCLAGGVPLSLEYLAAVRDLADRHKLPVYLDGARVFNAAQALGVEAPDVTRYADALMFCLSKGLAAPMGSMICGSKAFIEEAYHYRKMLGGQMRQAGFLAAAGIVALERMIDRLVDDHRHAQLLAGELSGVEGLCLLRAAPPSNMVFFRSDRPALGVEALEARLESMGLKVLPMGDWLRAVTHYGIEADDVRQAADIIRRAVATQ